MTFLRRLNFAEFVLLICGAVLSLYEVLYLRKRRQLLLDGKKEKAMGTSRLAGSRQRRCKAKKHGAKVQQQDEEQEQRATTHELQPIDIETLSDEEQIHELLKHYERFGHVVTVKLHALKSPHLTAELLTKHASKIADMLSVPSCAVSAVVADEEGIAGELRQPVHAVVWSRCGASQNEGASKSAVMMDARKKSMLKVLSRSEISVGATVSPATPVKVAKHQEENIDDEQLAATADVGERTTTMQTKGGKRKKRRGGRDGTSPDPANAAPREAPDNGGENTASLRSPSPPSSSERASSSCKRRSVVAVAGGRSGPLSEDEVVDLTDRIASSDTFTTHVENGTKYSFDVLKVMFCSGNTTERMHFGSNIKARGETVVDMFAGIGYFTLPLSRNGGIHHLYALEKNPDSCAYLRYNSQQNGTANVITVVQGDNREVGNELIGRCDRVLMGYIPSCAEFLPRAVSFLKHVPAIEGATCHAAAAVGSGSGTHRGSSRESSPVSTHSKHSGSNNGSGGGGRVSPTMPPAIATVPYGIIHYHFLADKPKQVARSAAYKDLTEQLGEDMVENFEIREIRTVKSFAPKRFHHVADIFFRPLFLRSSDE